MFSVLAWNAGAQNLSLAKLGEMSKNGRVSFDFRYSSDGTPEISGSVIVQGNLYTMKVGEDRVVCDGKRRYTIDNGAREVYIENADNISALLTNPKLQNSVSSLKYGADGKSLSGVIVNPDDKKKYSFSLSNIVCTQKSEDKSAFAFSTSSLGDNWVITDLR